MQLASLLAGYFRKVPCRAAAIDTDLDEVTCRRFLCKPPQQSHAEVVKAGPGILGAVTAFNNSTNAAYVHVYNTSSSVTAGAGTPDDRYLIPGATGGAEMRNPLPPGGTHYDTGIVFTVTTGIADTDTGSPATNSYLVSCYFK